MPRFVSRVTGLTSASCPVGATQTFSTPAKGASQPIRSPSGLIEGQVAKARPVISRLDELEHVVDRMIVINAGIDPFDGLGREIDLGCLEPPRGGEGPQRHAGISVCRGETGGAAPMLQ